MRSAVPARRFRPPPTSYPLSPSPNTSSIPAPLPSQPSDESKEHFNAFASDDFRLPAQYRPPPASQAALPLVRFRATLGLGLTLTRPVRPVAQPLLSLNPTPQPGPSPNRPLHRRRPGSKSGSRAFPFGRGATSAGSMLLALVASMRRPYAVHRSASGGASYEAKARSFIRNIAPVHDTGQVQHEREENKCRHE